MAEIKYLNDTGLKHLISKVKSALSEKQAKGDYAELVNGKIPSGMLPAYVDDVVEFGGMPDKGIKILQNSTAEWTKVIYDSGTKRFYATKGVEVEDSTALVPGGTAKPKLLEVYDNWTERENFQELTTNVPYSGKIYIDTTGNKQYRWSGSELVEISSGGVVLGETDSTAYPGNKGAANARYRKVRQGRELYSKIVEQCIDGKRSVERCSDICKGCGIREQSHCFRG